MSDIAVLASVAPIAVASAGPVATEIGRAVTGILSQHGTEIGAIVGATVLVVIDGLVDRFVTTVPWLRIVWGVVRGRTGQAVETATREGLRRLDGERHD